MSTPQRRVYKSLVGDSTITQCTTDSRHEPLNHPWWSGDSLYAGRYSSYVVLPSPGTRFYHSVWRSSSLDGTIPAFEIGDIITSPAMRQQRPARLSLTDCGCNDYGHYDPHAVYFSTCPMPSDGPIYVVEPIGDIWPDPEESTPTHIYRWCARSVRVIDLRISP